MLAGMELRTGKVVGKHIVLDDTEGLEEGADVRVWIGDPDEPVEVTDEEHTLILEGREAARRGQLLDARAFLRELRRAD